MQFPLSKGKVFVMSVAAAQHSFEFLETLPTKEVQLSPLEQYERWRAALQDRHVVPPALAGVILGVSKQRVHDLMAENKLQVVEILGKTFLTEESVLSYAKSVKAKGGRGKKWDLLKAAHEDAKVMVK